MMKLKASIIPSANGFGITVADKIVRKNLQKKARLVTLSFELMQMDIT